MNTQFIVSSRVTSHQHIPVGSSPATTVYIKKCYKGYPMKLLPRLFWSMKSHSYVPTAASARAWINTSSKDQQLSRTWQLGKEDLSMWKVHFCKGAVKKQIPSGNFLLWSKANRHTTTQQNFLNAILRLQHNGIHARQNAPLAGQLHQQCSIESSQPTLQHGWQGHTACML